MSMVGESGIYRRRVGIDPAHKPVRRTEFLTEDPMDPRKKVPDPVKQAEHDKFVGADYFDSPAVVISQNSDGTVNLRVWLDPVRDAKDTDNVRNVPVSSTASVGAFTPTVHNVTVSTPATPPVTTTSDTSTEKEGNS